MRAQHQQECAAFARQVNTDRQALLHRQGAERTEFQRQVDTTQAALLARHRQQEGAYWTIHHQKQTKVCSPPGPAPPTRQQVYTSAAHATNLRPSAVPTTAPDRKPMPKPEPAKKHSLPKSIGEQKSIVWEATLIPTLQQPEKQGTKQASLPCHVQQQIRKDAAGAPQPANPGLPNRNGTAFRSKASPKKDVETIDLCDSDDDILVEVSKADYQKTATPATTPAPFCPATPTATLQLFGEPFQKQAVSFETYPDQCSLLIVEAKSANYSRQAREARERSVYAGSNSISPSSLLPDYCQQDCRRLARSQFAQHPAEP